MPTLPAYRIHLDDDTSYITSMAAGVTIEQARAYFLGRQIEVDESRPMATVVAVTHAEPCIVV